MSDFDRLLRDALRRVGDSHVEEQPADVSEVRRAVVQRARRRRIAVASAAVATIGVLAVGALWASRPLRTEVDTDAAVPFAAASATIDVGAYPESIAVGEGAVWVGRRNGELVRIDPATNKVVAKRDIGSAIVDVAVGNGGVYVASTPHGEPIQWISGMAADTIYRIDPATNKITDGWNVGASQMRLAVNEQGVWFLANTNGGDHGEVHLLDPATGDVTVLEGTASSLAATSGGIWFTTMLDGAYAVGRFGEPFNDPGDRVLTSGLTQEIPAGGNDIGACADCPPPPNGIAVGDDVLLAGWNVRTTLSLVDTQFDDRPLETIEVEDRRLQQLGLDRPSVTIAHDSAWAIGANQVLRIDLESGRIDGDPIEVGKAPYDIAAGYGSVWVTNLEDGTVTRIDPNAEPPSPPPVAEESPTPTESPSGEAPGPDEAAVTGEGFGMWPVHTRAEYRRQCRRPDSRSHGGVFQWWQESAEQVAAVFGHQELDWPDAAGYEEGGLLDPAGTVRVALFPQPVSGPPKAINALRGVVDVYLFKPGRCWLITSVSRPGEWGEVDVSFTEKEVQFNFEIPWNADQAIVWVVYRGLARGVEVTEQDLPVGFRVDDLPSGPGHYLVLFQRDTIVGAEGGTLPAASDGKE
jgi:DNA-binding beta-propeller fold protein YncE